MKLVFLLAWFYSIMLCSGYETMQDVFSGVVTLNPKAPRHVPKYMHEMYWRNQYPDDEIIKSLLPQDENLSSPNVNLFQYILFNLTSISTPHISRSELRLDVKEPSVEFQSYYHHRFKARRINLAPPIKLQLFLIRSDKVVLIDTALFDWHKADWISVDITSGMQELFLKSYKVGDSILLGFRFQTMSGKVILPGSILKYKSRNRENNVYTDNIERLKTMGTVEDETQPNIQKTKTEYVETWRPDNQVKYSGRNSFTRILNFNPKLGSSKLEQSSRQYNKKHKLTKRSALKNLETDLTRSKRQNQWKIADEWSDNQLTLSNGPEYRNKSIYHYQIVKTSRVIEASTQSADKKKQMYENDVHVVDNINHFRPDEETGKFSSVLIIHMSEKNKDEVEVDNEIKNLKETKVHSKGTPQSEKLQSCQRKTLFVKFADFGWNNWIIEPQIFQAYYCLGKCSFPISKSAAPSSHAYLQSAMYLVAGTPGPCCVPETYSPLRVLYQESPHVVVLRYFNDMRVETCACR